jgi:hypothetical protein
MSGVGFMNYVSLFGGNYRLSSGSAYHNKASDGTDVGVNFDTLNGAAGTSY